MSKSIKVSEENHQKLLRLMQAQESFNDVISRLLQVTELLIKVAPIIEGQRSYLESKRREREAQEPVD